MKGRYLGIILIFLFALIHVHADNGYNIKVKIRDYKSDTLLLGYYLGDKQYIKDTAYINKKDGTFYFKGDKDLEGGMYLMVMLPKKDFFQVLINPGEQNFSVETTASEPFSKCQFKGSPENELFMSYIKYLEGKRPVADSLSKLKTASTDSLYKKKIDEQLKTLGEEVKKYQDMLIGKYPKSLTAALIKSNEDVKIPEFTGDEKDVQEQKYEYYKQHYFDNIDPADPRMLRTPVLNEKFKTYIEKLTPQHPDSISQSLDRILELLRPNQESFKYYLITYLNDYAANKYVGMDAVYVHLVKKYYEKGQAPWTDKEQLAKIIQNANTLEPILIGKKAPEITLYRRSGEKISLYDVKADFTILVIWAPDCGHCQKAMPKLKDEYPELKKYGAEVFTICAKVLDEVKTCWEFVDKNQLDIWINTVDPKMESRYKQKYDAMTTPKVYVLDKNKKIISKNISIEQLVEVIPKLKEMESKKEQ